MKKVIAFRVICTYTCEYDEALFSAEAISQRMEVYRQRTAYIMAESDGNRIPLEPGMAIIIKEQGLGSLDEE